MACRVEEMVKVGSGGGVMEKATLQVEGMVMLLRGLFEKLMLLQRFSSGGHGL